MTTPAHELIRSKRKTLALVIKPDGSLLVRAPMRASKTAIEDFIEKNRAWIEKHRAKALATLPPAPKQYIRGERFPYLGTTYPLEVVEGQREPLRLDGTFKLAIAHQNDAARVFESWYRQHARQIISARVEFFARQYDFQYKGIRITSARTRWGSCSATGSLSFSWRLVLAPLVAVDYVVVHELVHTVFHNHSKQFWRRVGTIMPEYPEHRKWLQEHARQILL